jgi:hypothetical protein
MERGSMELDVAEEASWWDIYSLASHVNGHVV